MNRRLHLLLDDRDAQTVRSVRALLAIGVVCLMFVAIAIAIVDVPAKPPVATQAPEPLPAVEASVSGA